MKLTFGPTLKILILFGLTFLSLGITISLPPMPQDPLYHHFADCRMCLIPSVSNVLSNFGFLIVSIWGLQRVRKLRHHEDLYCPQDPAFSFYIIFFISIGLTALGSSYYHLNPQDSTLFWDRLPMSLSFMSLVSAVLYDRLPTLKSPWIGRLLLCIGASSVLYWDITERLGHGDLRFYGFVQFYSFVFVVSLNFLFPLKGRYPVYLAYAFLWMALAKILELYDHEVFHLTLGMVSGHTVKHLTAALSVLMILPYLGVSLYPKARKETSGL